MSCSKAAPKKRAALRYAVSYVPPHPDCRRVPPAVPGETSKSCPSPYLPWNLAVEKIMHGYLLPSEGKRLMDWSFSHSPPTKLTFQKLHKQATVECGWEGPNESRRAGTCLSNRLTGFPERDQTGTINCTCQDWKPLHYWPRFLRQDVWELTLFWSLLSCLKLTQFLRLHLSTNQSHWMLVTTQLAFGSMMSTGCCGANETKAWDPLPLLFSECREHQGLILLSGDSRKQFSISP